MFFWPAPVTAIVKCKEMTDISDLIDRTQEWPESWKIVGSDLEKSDELVSIFVAFLNHIAEKGLTKRTIRRHLDYLWLLGGEIISKINYYPDDRHKSAMDLLGASVDPEGGPLSRHLSTEAEIKSFDATCRKLYAFLEQEGGI